MKEREWNNNSDFFRLIRVIRVNPRLKIIVSAATNPRFGADYLLCYLVWLLILPVFRP